MNQLLRLFKQFGFKIALAISLMCIGLFGLVYVVVVRESKNSFIQIVKEQIPFEKFYFNPGNGSIPPLSSRDILRFDVNGVERPKPLSELFTQTLQSSLIWVSLFAISLSFLIGYFASQLFNQPLKKLSLGMQGLRQNNYHSNLEKTGTEEIDQVVDEFNRLAVELQKVETLRKDLISDTSHELKTPLTSLMGQIEAIKDGILKPDKKRMDLLLGQVTRLSEMVEKLQEFSRIRAKSMQIDKTVISLKLLLERVAAIEEKELNKNGLELRIDVDDDYNIVGNEEMLERMVINLFDNSITYSKGNTIIISADENELAFRDNGIGVSEKHLPYIFERFYRVEKSRNRKTGGLGLGLAIVKEIAEVHGWKIEAKNENGLKIKIMLKY